jgi:hypothetical protein
MHWLDVLAWLAVISIFTFSSYQFCEYCREARLNVIRCMSKLWRKFIGEFIDDFGNNLPGPRR